MTTMSTRPSSKPHTKKRKNSSAMSPAELAKGKKRKQRASDASSDEDINKKKSQKQDNTKENPPIISPVDNNPQIMSNADFLSVLRIAAATTSATDTGDGLLDGDISSESILRAMQGIDMRRFARTNNSSALQLPQTGTSQPKSIAQSRSRKRNSSFPGQAPVSTGKTASGSTNTNSYNAIEELNSQGSAQLLATKWMHSAKLAELAKTTGLIYKKGKFSNLEVEQVNGAIERYAQARELNDDQLNQIIFPKDDTPRDNAFWAEITGAVPLRPIISVYHYVRRSRHPLKSQGKWLPAEDQKLKEAVASLGHKWEQVSLVVGRKAPDCRDRWRNHIVGRDVRINGPWSPEEEEELTRIVKGMTVKQGGTLDDDLFWVTVSDLMGNKRNRQQCRIKWTDSLSKRVKSNGNESRWSNRDAYILVHKLDSLEVRDDSEIDWKTLPDEDWNLWSAHTLQRRWLSMKRSIKGFEEMSIQEMLVILKEKIYLTPETKQKSVKKYPSPEMVESSSEED